MVLQVQTLLLLGVVGQDVLALAVGVVAAAILEAVVVDGRGERAGEGGAVIGAVGRV